MVISIAVKPAPKITSRPKPFLIVSSHSPNVTWQSATESSVALTMHGRLAGPPIPLCRPAQSVSSTVTPRARHAFHFFLRFDAVPGLQVRYVTRPSAVVDTLALEHRRQRRHHHVEANASLRLADLRATYGLPRYAAHDCLVDAVATAELLMAIVAHRQISSLGDLTS